MKVCFCRQPLPGFINVQGDERNGWFILEQATGRPVEDHKDIVYADDDKGEYAVLLRKNDGSYQKAADGIHVAVEVRRALITIINAQQPRVGTIADLSRSYRWPSDH